MWAPVVPLADAQEGASRPLEDLPRLPHQRPQVAEEGDAVIHLCPGCFRFWTQDANLPRELLTAAPVRHCPECPQSAVKRNKNRRRR